MHATLHSEGTKCRFNTSSFGSRTFFSSKKAVHSAGPQNKAAGSIDQSASIRNLQVAQDQDADEGSLWVAAEWWFLAGATEGFVLTRCVVHADSFGTDCCHACPQTLPLGRLLSTHCWTRTSTQTNVEQSTWTERKQPSHMSTICKRQYDFGFIEAVCGANSIWPSYFKTATQFQCI